VNKNILVIGSKGFIGSHITDHFQQVNRYNVYECDVMVNYIANNYFQLDPVNADFQEIFEQVKPDICINCSGAANVPDSLIHPYRDFILNTGNVYKMLEAIRKHAPNCRFINLSSAAVYGNPVSLPIKETDISKPVSPYGSHKLQAEMICDEFYQFFNINTCSVRIFSAYGEGLTKQLFWDLAQKSKQDKTISLFGTGNESRDFIYVKDIARIIELIIYKASFTAECYNVGNGIEISIKEVAELFLQLLKWNGNLLFKGSARKGDPSNWQADISKIKSLGYTSLYTVETGLKNYVEWLVKEKLV
jgi:UDP-glucose 4-epimerase